MVVQYIGFVEKIQQMVKNINDKCGKSNKNMLTDKPQMFTFMAAGPP